MLMNKIVPVWPKINGDECLIIKGVFCQKLKVFTFWTRALPL